MRKSPSCPQGTGLSIATIPSIPAAAGRIAPRTGSLAAARRGEEDAFDRLVRPHRAELLAHCYRMLGSVPDAEDALQDALLSAWRGLRGFEGRSSLRSWLYKIATNACLKAIERRPKRVLPLDYGPAADPHVPDAIGAYPTPSDVAMARPRRVLNPDCRFPSLTMG